MGAATAAQPEAVTPVALPEGSSGSEVVQIQTAPLVSEAGPAVGDEMPGRRYRLEMVNGKPMIWPDLAAPMYRRAGRPMAAARFLKSRRRAIDRLRQPEPGPGRAVAPAADRLRSEERRFPRALPTNAPAAAHFLEADLEYLRAAVGRGDFFRAIALYGRALRIAPEFRDRDRGRLMMGLARLTMGLAMEAEATFVRLAGETEDPWAASLAYLGAARAGRVAGGTARAIQLLRRAIASERRSEGACRARGDLGIVLVESGEAKDGLVLFDEMRSLCPAEIVRAPEMTFSYVGLLAAAGHLEEAEDLLMTLPDYDGDAFVQRKFLEADLANATGTPDLARQAYEAVRASNHSPPRIRAEATMRLARVEDRAGNHDRADTLLRQLADESAVVGVRAKALATAAELLARRHRYADGLRILAQTDVLGPAGFAAAERVRSWLFRSWIDELAERGDEAGIVAVYYRWRGDGIGRHLGVDEMVRVASAAVAAGLPELAVRVLSAVQGRVRGPTRIRARRILAEAALAAGESAEALRLTEEIVRTAGNGAPRRDVALVRAHALVHLGRVEEGSALLQAVGGRENLIGVGSAYLRSGMEPRRAYEILNTALAGMENGSESERSRVILDGWLALADAAGAAGEKERAAAALQTAIRLFPEEQLAGARYRVASFESSDGDPATAARRLAAAAQTERDPLFARLAAAEAAYYRALDHAEVRR